MAASRSSCSRCSSLNPTYRSAVPADRLALLRRKLQCLLIGSYCLVETTLRNPDIRQDVCAQPICVTEMWPAIC